MGKILKYCTKCDEGFAEKFGFCPNCGETLQAFEMNPLAAETASSVEAEVPPAPAFIETAEVPFVEAAAAEEEILEIDEPTVVEEIIEEPVFEKAQVAAPTEVFYQSKPLYADAKPVSLEAEHDKAVAAGGYYLTVIEEKNVKQRNSLLLGTLGLMLFALMSGMVYNIFSKDLDIASINDDIFNAVIVEDVPVTEEEIQLKKDKGGGGGGGGDNDPNPASKGERPPMRTDPQFKPSATSERLTNPTIPIQQAIKGPINEKFKVDGRYGVKFGSDNPSNGPGSGGGIGSGRNGGVGGGDGPGYGPGSGGGLGGGNRGGIGPGNGPGGGGSDDPPRARGESAGIKILSKPRPGYTDAARQNNVQGTVILRVTFLASGQVGSVSAVKGLPNGLTEMAISAAKRISFTPAKSNGVPQAVTRQIEYTFSIY
jgi:TonB family protein